MVIKLNRFFLKIGYSVVNKLDTFQNNMGEKHVKVGLGFEKKKN